MRPSRWHPDVEINARPSPIVIQLRDGDVVVSAQRRSDRFGGRNFDDFYVPGMVSFVVVGGGIIAPPNGRC